MSNTQHLLKKGLPLLTSVKSGNPHATIGKWLLGCSGVVVGIVHIGGVTRLTKSGLSMTDWKPLGSLPPISLTEWNTEFARYQQFPEWEQRKSMTMSEFQRIYYWEWGHRMLGRFVGVSFAVPWAYFAMRGRIPQGYGKRMGALFAMGGGQGLVGWWMVKSGLGENRRGDSHEIRVSPYRLAAHLSMAFSTYTLLLWTGLDLLHYPNTNRNRFQETIQSLRNSMSKQMLQHAKKLRGGAILTTGLTAITVVSGAFVAGNDAGNAYNTFPKMHDQWIPYDDMVDPTLSPKHRNLFENTATVQWNHRVLGCTTAASVLTLSGLGLLHPAGRAVITPQVRKGLLAMGGIAVGQVTLGIVTLLNYVPVTIAAAHQLGSLALLSSGIYLVHSLRYAAPRTVKSIMPVAAAASSGAGKRVVGMASKAL